MNNKNIMETFKSYIGCDAITAKNNTNKNGAIQELKPKLLNGELVTGEAHNVVLLPALSDREQGRMGSLFITNYKLSFVPAQPDTHQTTCQRNALLGAHDVPLGGVCSVWLTSGLVRKRLLTPHSSLPAKVKGLQIVCKNMAVMTLSFCHSPVGNGRKVALALLHHAWPKRHDLLFAYEHRERYYPTLHPHINMFLSPGDWKRELERCGCPYWRISCINGTSDAFMSGASETLVVPSSALDFNLIEASRHFRGGRIPVWVWGRAEGAALLRSGELLATEQAATAESVLLEQVRRSHPKLAAPHILYLRGGSPSPAPPALPSLPALQASWKKLAELCTPPTLRAFWEQDSQYYSLLESSRWLHHVAAALRLAADAARRLSDNVTVVLQEGEGVDYSALVSSLTQLLLDPRARSISGFQSLVQKEWVALGHPFCDRLGHVTPASARDKDQSDGPTVAPVFLLFLDCTWQLLQQFPSAFQFTETYLTTLWDSTHNQLFDTFLFNCPRDRELAVAKDLILRPVWDWGEQFTEQETCVFYNPLYTAPAPANNRLSQISTLSRSPPTAERGLVPCTSLAAVELWSQCYERWLPPLDAFAGGNVQYQIHNNAVLQEIHELNERLRGAARSRPVGASPAGAVRRQLVSRFYPFSSCSGEVPAPSLDVMQVGLMDASELLDSLSLLNAPD